ncbi:hypothetical protein SERLADRAFT_459498 [Serpula lacrymans var. lacrymans S7.9]|uniref:Uncharacterized protein n=1 Tax=Serpula lacrymans var. lacrymans (strain S7.9) TaxID=578457 RepID=F8NK60_SERL9|nr:uncharacterized protein SERLADRAFT_459498 [Serpula lacrymans var. lacrymans S7.9]EGO28744.1 hypothetical protein SERLADRAFT_459498 [Serpula lacrymans var. lacrymans S7.9]
MSRLDSGSSRSIRASRPQRSSCAVWTSTKEQRTTRLVAHSIQVRPFHEVHPHFLPVEWKPFHPFLCSSSVKPPAESVVQDMPLVQFRIFLHSKTRVCLLCGRDSLKVE